MDRESSEEFFLIGAIVKPRGLRGEVRVRVLCNSPEDFRDCVGTGRLLLWNNRPGADARPCPVQVASLRFHAGEALVFLDGIASVEAAEPLRGFALGLRREDLPEAAEDSYYYYQLEGLQVVGPSGEVLGTVRSVEENPAHDLLCVTPGDPSAPFFRVPFVAAFVKRVDLAGGRIEVDLPDGLIESQR